jgi:hypothetical protein
MESKFLPCLIKDTKDVVFININHIIKYWQPHYSNYTLIHVTEFNKAIEVVGTSIQIWEKIQEIQKL